MNIFTEHIVPCLGILTTFGIFYSSLKRVYEIELNQHLAQYDSTPNVWLLTNSFAWLVYGYFIQKYYLCVPQIVGIQCMFYSILTVFPFHSRKQQLTIKLILMVSSFVVFSSGTIAFVSFPQTDIAKNILGSIAVFVLCCFYTSPLSNLVMVIKTRDASSINIWLSIANLVNGSLWTCYGFALSDMFIALPNLLGILSSIIQIVLVFVFKKKDIEKVDEVVILD